MVDRRVFSDWGSSALLASSARSSSVCSGVGTWPVSKSQNMDSGKGSLNLLGSFDWHSGIVRFLNFIPSYGSTRDVEVSKAFTPLIPLSSCSTVIWSTGIVALCFFSFRTRSRSVCILDSRTCLKEDEGLDMNLSIVINGSG